MELVFSSSFLAKIGCFLMSMGLRGGLGLSLAGDATWFICLWMGLGWGLLGLVLVGEEEEEVVVVRCGEI